MKSILSCFNAPFCALIFALCIASVHADDKPTQKEQPDGPHAASVSRPGTRIFAVSELRDIRLNASLGHITFTAGDSTYTYSPDFGQNSGANVSACIAVLAELRRVKSFEATVSVPSKESKACRIGELIIPFSELK